jgi:hypothetical protein
LILTGQEVTPSQRAGFEKAFERFSKIGLKASAVFQKPALPITPKAFKMIERERFYQN